MENNWFVFESDDDGHKYLIPADKIEEFQQWEAAAPYWEDYDGTDFNDYRIDSVYHYKFQNPVENL